MAQKQSGASKRRRTYSTLSKSGKYFRDNPKAARKKDAYNRKAAKKRLANGTSTRAERATKSRAARKRGIDTTKKDYDHAVGRFVSQKTNRGRADEGGRKKGVSKMATKRKPRKASKLGAFAPKKKTAAKKPSGAKRPKTGPYSKAAATKRRKLSASLNKRKK